MKNSLQYDTIIPLKGGEDMAEKKENEKKQYKTLRAYLVCDYIMKKLDYDTFQLGKLNAYLANLGIECDNRTIVRDIEAINQALLISENDLDCVEEANLLLKEQSNAFIIRDDNWGGYRINRERFKIKDLSLIAECIGAARFIDTEETERLIDILCRFLNPKDVEQIQADVKNIQRDKVRSYSFYESYEILNDIVNDVVDKNALGIISFDYLTYDIDHVGKPISKHQKERCLVYPHKIVNHNALYYLIAYDNKKRAMRVFRIDRIQNVDAHYDEHHGGQRLAAKMDFSTLATRTFDMCLGESTRVTLRCTNDIFDTIYERFGTDNVLYRKCGDKEFEVTVVLDVSPKFFGWLCGFGKEAKLVSPPAVVDEFYNYIDEIKGQYNSK